MGTEDGAEATQGQVAGAEIANEESPLGDSVKTSGASVPCLTALLGAGADGPAGEDRPSSPSGEEWGLAGEDGQGAQEPRLIWVKRDFWDTTALPA